MNPTIQELQAALKTSESDRKSIAARLKDAQQTNRDLTAELEELQKSTSSAAKDTEIATLKSDLLKSDGVVKDLRAQVARLSKQGALGEVMEELKATTEDLDRAEANLARLERLSQVRGVQASDAVPLVPTQGSGPGDIYDRWLKAEGAEKTLLWRENRAAIRAAGNARRKEDSNQ